MKFSQVTPNATPALADYLMGVTAGGVDFRTTLTNLVAVIMKTSLLTNPYKLHAYGSAAANANNGATTKIPFDAEMYDTGNNFDSVTNNRFTAPANGVYHFDYKCPVAQTNGYHLGFVYKNGVEIKRTAQTTGSTVVIGAVGSCDLQLVAGDYVEIYYRTDGSTSAWEINAGATGSAAPFLSGHYVGQ